MFRGFHVTVQCTQGVPRYCSVHSGGATLRFSAYKAAVQGGQLGWLCIGCVICSHACCGPMCCCCCCAVLCHQQGLTSADMHKQGSQMDACQKCESQGRQKPLASGAKPAGHDPRHWPLWKRDVVLFAPRGQDWQADFPGPSQVAHDASQASHLFADVW